MWNLIFNSDTNKHLHNRNRITDIENRSVFAKSGGERWTERLGINRYSNYYIYSMD